MICSCCRAREAHPEAFGLCAECDDAPERNAFASETCVVGDPTVPDNTWGYT